MQPSLPLTALLAGSFGSLALARPGPGLTTHGASFDGDVLKIRFGRLLVGTPAG
jgi:hypothetical protein